MKCAVVGCNNCSGSKLKGVDGITFHVFPVDPEIRNEWVNILNKPNSWTPTKYSKICSIHFEEKDFYTTKKKSYKKLQLGAVPKLFLTNQESKAQKTTVDNSAPKIEKELEPCLEDPLNKTPMDWEMQRLKYENAHKTKKIAQLQAKNRRLKKKLETVELLLSDLQ